MPVSSIADVVAAFEEGRFFMSRQVRKLPSASWTNGYWFDTTMATGFPLPSYYASTPLAFAAMSRSTHGGWDHGGDVAPRAKYLKRLAFTYAGFSADLLVTDVLGYYPFVDEAAPGEEQICDNTNARPARFGDGKGVRAYIVSVAPSALAVGNTITLTYTNSDGVAGRTSTLNMLTASAAAVNGALPYGPAPAGTSPSTPFFPLQQGDLGVRQIDSVRIDGPGDTGLLTVVLCRPIARGPSLPNIAAEVVPRVHAEHDFLRTYATLPKIDDDAFLSCLLWHYHSSSSKTNLAALNVEFDVIWR